MQNIGSHPEHHVCLNSSARADILWWYLFATDWNGISMLWDIGKLLPEFNIVSDTSGTWGCGAYIAIKGLIPVVVAAALFGNQWQDHYCIMCASVASNLALLNRFFLVFSGSTKKVLVNSLPYNADHSWQKTFVVSVSR